MASVPFDQGACVGDMSLRGEIVALRAPAARATRKVGWMWLVTWADVRVLALELRGW